MIKRIKIFLKLSFLISISGAFFYIYYNFSPLAGQIPFPKCPSYSILHINCAGCGSQRAVHELLHLNFLKAFYYNPLFILALPFLIYLFGVILYNFIFDKNIKLKILYTTTFANFLIYILIIYTILRNLPFQFLSIFNPNS